MSLKALRLLKRLEIAKKTKLDPRSIVVSKVFHKTITINEAKAIHRRMKFRHEQTNYDMLLKSGISKATARQAMQPNRPEGYTIQIFGIPPFNCESLASGLRIGNLVASSSGRHSFNVITPSEVKLGVSL